ncbi:MAG TPA: 2-C-methyl-D-erythritol 4-phosphate cytidylyltransferase [Candidatus Baltobacteraceae bacterium]|nr:2-C-methyl-D-erythritol 4-phosphate cytidylyltransferase [Candidatus Baltobacteraceae bacterium]
MKWAAIIVAAGRGARLGRPKQFLELAGLPMVGWSIRTFAEMPEIAALVIATEPESVDDMKALAGRLVARRAVTVVRGGTTRQGSVRAALAAVPAECDAVLVHDGARPLVTPVDVRAGMAEVRERRAALLAAPTVDTIKIVDALRRVTRTLERDTLWSAQTPQFALTAELRDAHARAESERLDVTDDAALLEHAGIEVVVVPSTSDNFKVTLPEDVPRAEALLRHPEPVASRPERTNG